MVLCSRFRVYGRGFRDNGLSLVVEVRVYSSRLAVSVWGVGLRFLNESLDSEGDM